MRPSEIPIPRPCDADWNAMTPVPGGRHCHACDLDVADLSSMTAREAREVVRAAAQRVCVRYQPTRDGRVRHRADPIVPAARLLARAKPAAFAAAVLLGGCDEPYWVSHAIEHPLDFATCVIEPHCDAFAPPAIAGEVAVPPPRVP